MTQAANLGALGTNAGTTGILPAAGGGTAGTAGVTGFKNRLINGAMVIDQRNSGAAVTINATANTYVMDRWRCRGETSDGVYTCQQVSDAPAGFKNSAKITVTTADASVDAGKIYGFQQLIEGFNFADLDWGTANAKSITISFWVNSSLTGTFGGGLTNGAGNRSYPFTYTISTANTWEKKSITIAGDTSGTWASTNTTALRLNYNIGAGSENSGPANAWAAANYFAPTGVVSVIGTLGATFYITGVQLEVGTTATNFDVRSYGTELFLCQRYYQMVTYAGKQYQAICLATAQDSTTVSTNFTLKTSMRAVPSLRYTSGNYYFWYSALTGFAFSTFDIDTNYTTGECVNLYTTGVSGATAGRSGTMSQSNTLGALAFSAEL
jgi:hypothetical protein